MSERVSVAAAWSVFCPLLLLAIVIAIVLLFRHLLNYNRRHTNSFLLVVFLVAVTAGGSLLLLLLGVMSYRQQESRPATVLIPADATELTIFPDASATAAVQLPSPPDEWKAADLTSFEADRYLSIVAAAAPLARKVHAALVANRLLATATDNDSRQPPSISIYTSELEEPLRAEVIQSFLAEVRLQFEGATISVREPNVMLADRHVFGNTVALILNNRQDKRRIASWDRNQFMSSGELQCEAITTLGRAEVAINYTEQPWVEAFDRFASERPGKRFIAGYSSSLASSENDAWREAMQNANEKLQRGGRTRFSLPQNRACDRFAQKLSRPYGDVWRVAILFDLSSPQVANMVFASDLAKSNQQLRMVSATFGIGFLFALTAVLCVLLNWLTLGYYRNQVGFGWAVAAVGLVVLGVLVMS